MTTTTETVAANIRKALKAEGYTPAHLAERLEKSYSQATRLYNGKSSYRPEHIGTIARMLGMSPETLIGVDKSKTTTYLTVNEAAKATKYHADTIRKAVYCGAMKSTQRCKGGKYLIKELDLAAWMAGAR